MWSAIVEWIESLPGWWEGLAWIVFIYIIVLIIVMIITFARVFMEGLALLTALGTMVLVEKIATLTKRGIYAFFDLVKQSIQDIRPYKVIEKGEYIHFITHNNKAKTFDGIVRIAPYKGALLSSMPLEHQKRLLKLCHDDEISLNGLLNFMNHLHGPNWKNSKNHQQHSEQQNKRQEKQEQHRSETGKVTYEHALEILDIPKSDNLTHKELKNRYRSIMAKVHPDKGGSNYFAKQVNEAMEVIKKRHGW